MLQRPPTPTSPALRADTEIRVAWATLLKILTAALAAYAIYKLRTGVELLLLAALFAVALSPAVDWLEERGLKRRGAVGTLALFGIIGVAVFALFVAPPLVAQIGAFWTMLPQIETSILSGVEPEGLLSHVLRPLFEGTRSVGLADWLSRPLTWGPSVVKAVAGAFVVAILSLYLLLDGRAVVAWLLAYVPRRHRGRMSSTVPEVFAVVRAYASGQLIVSGLFAGFCYAVLTALGVPAAIPLALFAGFCAAIPVVGVLVSMAAAGLVALTAGPATSLIVLTLYLAYHQFEAYLLVPRLFGERLRLSPLTVFLALLAGGLLNGVIGAILALPIVAAYPVVEKYWLSGYLHPDAVEDHASLRAARGEAEDHEAAVDAVLKGEKVPPPAAGTETAPVLATEV
ncbi:MAG: AI-2E family transporter [Acidobacteria bacterium]|nr:AI-2E family transporter [Acidobacteriota bacterium]